MAEPDVNSTATSPSFAPVGGNPVTGAPAPNSPPVPADERSVQPLWRNGNFELLWVSVAASGFADRMTQLAAWSMLGIYLAGSQASSITAGVSFFFFLPYVVLGLPAGWIADTLPRKWVMMGCDLGRAAIMFLAFALVPSGPAMAVGHQHFWKVYGIMLAVGTLAAVLDPAKAATVPQIVPASQLQPANAIVLGIAVIASLLGFLVGDPIIGHYSVRAGLLLGVAVYLVSGTLFGFMRIPRRTVMESPGPKRGELHRMFDAMTYTVRHRPIFELTLLSILFWAVAYALLSAITAMCKDRFGLPEADVVSSSTHMMAILGVGMMLSSGLVAWMNTRRESAWFTMLSLLAAGVLILVMAVSRSYYFSLLLAIGVGFFGNTAMICVATLTQSIAPDYIRGRVFGVRDLFSLTSAVIVNLVIWRLPHADTAMIPATMGMGAVLTLVGAWGSWREITRGPMATRTLNSFWRFTRVYCLVWHRLRWIGRDAVPRTGAVILAANHTAGIDPFLIQSSVPRLIRWVMMDSYRYRILNPLWNAVNPIALESGGLTLTQMRALLTALKQNEIVGLFPEGSLQRGHRNLQPFQPGLGLLARRSGAAIVPVWIAGTPISNSMLWHFLHPSHSTVTFGQPYVPDAKMSDEEIMEDLRQRMLALSGSGSSGRVGRAPSEPRKCPSEA